MIVVAVCLEPHGSTTEHSSEVPILFLVTTGRGFVRIGGSEGETRPLTAGDAVLWPAHLDHMVWIEDEPLEAILSMRQQSERKLLKWSDRKLNCKPVSDH
jgi:quercetin dioxygenase-like cupin family protein